jgi:hypothetical protein
MPSGKRPRLLFLANFLFVPANRRAVSAEQAAASQPSLPGARPDIERAQFKTSKIIRLGDRTR